VLNRKTKSKGFSLAEVILTMTVVGCIACLTVPSLIYNVEDKLLRTGWKEAYSVLNQVNAKALSDLGGDFTGVFSDRSDFKNKMKGYFSYSKECEDNQSDGKCWPSPYYKMNGTPVSMNNVPALVLSNGMFIRFYMDPGGTGTNCQETAYYTTGECGMYEVDVNGFKSPNKFGRDIFFAHVLENRIRPVGVAETTNIWRNCDIDIGGQGCGATYLMQ
jgi:hypothetical protein